MSDLIYELSNAAYRGNLTKVRELLSAGVDPNAWDPDDVPPMGAFPNEEPDEYPMVLPLYNASLGGNIEIVRELLSAGADPNLSNSLHGASLGGNIEIVRELLSAGADLNLFKNPNNVILNPLCAAIKSENLPMVRLLLAEGSTPSLYPMGSMPIILKFAVHTKNESILNTLIDTGIDLDIPDAFGRTPLHEAAVIGSYPMVKSLLDAGANPTFMDSTGMTPLYYAAKGGNIQMVDAILPISHRILSQDEAPNAVLRILTSIVLIGAVRSNRIGLINHMLENGANPNSTNRDGNTPLHEAAYKGHLELVEVLLVAGANPNAKDERGTTPLHKAGRRGHLPIVRTLLAAGADPNATDRDGRTPLYYAYKRGDKDCIKILLDAGANASNVLTNDRYALHESSKINSVPMIRSLLSTGADPNAADRGGRTPLYWAVNGQEFNNFDSVHSLINAGAKVGDIERRRAMDPRTEDLLRSRRHRNENVTLLVSRKFDNGPINDIRKFLYGRRKRNIRNIRSYRK